MMVKMVVYENSEIVKKVKIVVYKNSENSINNGV